MAKSENENIDRFGINSRDQTVRARPARDGVTIQVPKSKAKGGNYFLDAELRAETGDFTSAGNFMSATVYGRAKALRALDVLMQQQAVYALPSMAAEARTILGDITPDAPAAKTDDTGSVAMYEHAVEA